jgi:hypothetical protein
LTDCPDPLEGSAGLEPNGVEPLLQLAFEASDERKEDSLLAPEVVVEDRLGDARSGDDLADGSGRVATAREEVRGGGEQPLACREGPRGLAEGAGSGAAIRDD